VPILGGGSGAGGRENPRERAERQARIVANVEEAKSLKALIDFLDKERQAIDETTDRYRHLTDRIEELNKHYDEAIHSSHDLLKEREKENAQLAKLNDVYRSLPGLISQTAMGIGNLFRSYHSYNLEVQKFIDLSGRFTGSSERGRREFEKMRNELKLTRDEVIRFGKSWSDMQRLGISTAQITQTTRQLRDRLGHTGAIAATETIAGAPISRGNLQGVLNGNATAMVRAIRSANLEQAHAISLVARGPRGELAEETARFDKMGADLAKLGDDLETAMAAGTAAGLGPELGAMVIPLTQINQNTARLLQWALGTQGWLHPLLTGLGARLGVSGVSGLGARLGLSGVSGIGATVSTLARSGAVRLGVGGLAAAGLAYGADALADRFAPGSTAQTVARGAGRGARVASYGLTGMAIGAGFGGVLAPVGAAIGTLTGAIAEFRGELVSGLGDIFRGATDWLQQRPQRETTTIGALGNRYATTFASVTEQLQRTATNLAHLPEVITSQMEQSRLPAALESVDPARMFRIGEAASEAFAKNLETGSLEWADTVSDIQDRVDELQGRLAGATTKEERAGLKELISSYNNQFNAVAQDMENNLNRSSIRPVAAGGMQRIETRGAQIGEEVQAARLEYQRTGAITGDLEANLRLQQQINTAYDEMSAVITKGGNNVIGLLQKEQARYAGLKDLAGISETERGVYQHQYDLTTNQLDQSRRQLAVRQNSVQLDKMNQVAEAQREQILSGENTISARRSRLNRALLQARESFIRERGARPGELGQVAGQQVTEATNQLSEFMRDFTRNMQDLQNQLQNAPDDARRVQIEETIFALANRRLELEHDTFRTRMHAATTEERYRQEQIAAQLRIVEINRDMSARVGQSWRVQMGYQAQIIRMQQEDLQSTRRELEAMARELGDNAMTDPAFINRMADLAQKQANLAEAIIGKQRTFLEQATAASFGVGSGTRVLPVVNPRIFGEQIQGFTGMKQPGVPLPMAQQRAILRGGMGPQIFGGIPGGLMGPGAVPGAGAGPGGAIGPAPVPGAPGAVPGAPGAVVPGGPRAQQSWDVSGQILVRVESTNPDTRAHVERTALRMTQVGAV
jgi:hypothetical protein